MDATRRSPTTQLTPRWIAHVVWFVLIATPVVVVIAMAAGTDQPDGQCSGIGWGCTLSGSDAAGLVAALLLPPALTVLAVGHVVIASVQSWQRQRHVRTTSDDVQSHQGERSVV